MIFILFVLCFRLYLAAIHFNENAVRPQMTTSKGKFVYKLLFPKAKKGGHTVKPVKTEPTFCKFFPKIFIVNNTYKCTK